MQSLKKIVAGKYLSILGDSISTYEGATNLISNNTELNAVYFDKSHFDLEDTYWIQLLKLTNMKLCINNSWSGAYLCNHVPNMGAENDKEGQISSGIYRADKLSDINGKKPDYILIFIGINDLNANISVDVIKESYDQMLDKVNNTYSEAKVFCINMPNRMNSFGSSAYNKVIEESINSHKNVFLIDLYNSELNLEKYEMNSFDNLHPNKIGMDYFTEIIIKGMEAILIK